MEKAISGSSMNIPHSFSESLETVFWVKNLKLLQFFDADLGSEIFLTQDPGSGIFFALDPGWKTSRIHNTGKSFAKI
jgi:hypothetical protein